MKSLLKDGDPLSAGRILADGIPIAVEARRQTVDSLLDRVTSDHPTAFESVSLLVDLATAPDVLTRLCAFVNDKRQTLWTRAVFADTLADLDASIGLDLLKRLVGDSRGTESDAIWWARQRLDSRGPTGSPSVAPDRFMMQSAKSLNELGRQACQGTAMDKSRPAKVRIQAAGILHSVGDDVGTQMLCTLVSDERIEANLRLGIARTLSASHHERGVAALRALAIADASGATQVSLEIRRAAANDLMSQRDPVGLKVLQQLASDYRLPRSDRRQIAAQLVEHDDPVGREILARLDRENAFRVARIQIGGLALAVVAPFALSARALLPISVMTTPTLLGLFCIAIVAALKFLEAAPAVARPMMRQTRPSRRQASAPRSRPRGLEYLATAVSKNLVDRQEASGRGKLIRTYLAPRNSPGTRLLPRDLKDVLIRAPGSLTVILGPPGSGKTQAVTTFVLETLTCRDKADIVPVFLSLRSWSASDRSLEDWISGQMASDYAMSVDEVKRYVDGGRILPVLDGLDEIIPDRQRVAWFAINAMGRRDIALIVTCRSRDYAELVEKVGAFNNSTLFDMQSVQPRDIVNYIRDNTTEDQVKAWTPVIRELDQASPGPFAELMANPLTATLTLQPYLTAGRNPGQLLRQIYSRGRSSADVSLSNVWEDYLSKAIDGLPGYSSETSRRWLRTIAYYMQSENVREFRWWNLRGLVPARLMFIMSLLAIVVPPATAVIVELSRMRVPLPTVVAVTVAVIGLVIISTQEPTEVPRGRTPSRSVGNATVLAVLQTAALAGGGGLLVYSGMGVPSALVVVTASAGYFWTTHAGRFMLSRIYLAGTKLLPWSLIWFLGATTVAGITVYEGPVYRFVHDSIQKYLLSADEHGETPERG